MGAKDHSHASKPLNINIYYRHIDPVKRELSNLFCTKWTAIIEGPSCREGGFTFGVEIMESSIVMVSRE